MEIIKISSNVNIVAIIKLGVCVCVHPWFYEHEIKMWDVLEPFCHNYCGVLINI
jgi:hypothetical protein